ncbi:hypothetical protein ABD76_24735 [Paenibacillus dendritiformis]|uniref:DUF6075 family protein n=1 Tax=Paenibacillus dendritiformis TaxID=130049 RepID=UPI0018CF3919|nr:DUF6075 family protein [Paenibacillus dendritiformis]MBG9795488.1 hypothetical protein [Paenibacillus dendritiformis]
MIFKDLAHEQFYEGNVIRTHRQHDPYRKALFYLLGLTEDTRRNINDLYNFKEDSIRLEGLNEGWQTGTTSRLTRLAFNLYTGYTGESEEDARYYSPYYLFDNGLLPYFFEAVKLRYPSYASDLSQSWAGFQPFADNGRDTWNELEQ